MTRKTPKYKTGDKVELQDTESTVFNGVKFMVTDRKWRVGDNGWEWSYAGERTDTVYVSESLLIPFAGEIEVKPE